MLVVGYMCQRPALLVRSKVAYEENIREKRRLAGESKRIFNAVNAAKEESITFLESEDGMLMVREEAEKRIIEMEAYVEEEGYKNSCGRNKLQPAIFSAVFAGAKSSVSKIKSQYVGIVIFSWYAQCVEMKSIPQSHSFR